MINFFILDIRILSQNKVSLVNLKEIHMPIVVHPIKILSPNFNAQWESLKASFKALAAVAKQLPGSTYNKLVTEYVGKLEHGINVELVIKTIIGMLNGYNVDLTGDNHSFMVGILHKLEKHLSKRISSKMKHKNAQKTNDVDKKKPNGTCAASRCLWRLDL